MDNQVKKGEKVRIRISVSQKIREEVYKSLHKAYRKSDLRLIKRIQALIYIFDGKSVEEVAQILDLSQQSVYNYINAFVRKGVKSLSYKRPPGRPAKLTKTQKKELGGLIEQGPEASGYDCGCWDTAVIADLIFTRFKVRYSTHYVAELLKNIGFSYQRARFVSQHIDDVSELQKEWMKKTWPEILKLGQSKNAMILFGDEVSFAQWGSLSRTWARKGEQPTVKTSGKRKGYKIFGLIDYFSGAFFYKGHEGRFNSVSYEAFLEGVLKKTNQDVILIQDGASYHTSKAMKAFFTKNEKRLTVFQLPKYSPEFNPIEYLWRNIKKQATHLRYFPKFEDLVNKVDQKLQYFANLPESITALMGRYCKSVGDKVPDSPSLGDKVPNSSWPSPVSDIG